MIGIDLQDELSILFNNYFRQIKFTLTVFETFPLKISSWGEHSFPLLLIEYKKIY